MGPSEQADENRRKYLRIFLAHVALCKTAVFLLVKFPSQTSCALARSQRAFASLHVARLGLGCPASAACMTAVGWNSMRQTITCTHTLPSLTDISSQVWRINRERAIDYLNTRNRIYVVDGFAGWDIRYRIRVRVVCARAYHALFMRNMLIRPSREELEHFEPDYTIYNAGAFPANRYTSGMTSSTSVALNFADKEMVILGTEYAGKYTTT